MKVCNMIFYETTHCVGNGFPEITCGLYFQDSLGGGGTNFHMSVDAHTESLYKMLNCFGGGLSEHWREHLIHHPLCDYFCVSASSCPCQSHRTIHLFMSVSLCI